MSTKMPELNLEMASSSVKAETRELKSTWTSKPHCPKDDPQDFTQLEDGTWIDDEGYPVDYETGDVKCVIGDGALENLQVVSSVEKDKKDE